MKEHTKPLAPSPPPTNARRTAIAVHLLFMLYGHWAVNDPRGAGSNDFIDEKFAPLGPIHFGRKPDGEQPTREELRSFHEHHRELLNFPGSGLIRRRPPQAIVEAIREVLREQKYTCYACAICSNHIHLVIRTHKHYALTMWENFTATIGERLRLRFPSE